VVLLDGDVLSNGEKSGGKEYKVVEGFDLVEEIAGHQDDFFAKHGETKRKGKRQWGILLQNVVRDRKNEFRELRCQEEGLHQGTC